MKFLMILLCKILAFIGKLVGKGSSLPGKIVLKLCPNILQKITLPKYVIAVTGSNGKSSTVETIANVMEENGLRVVWNKEGSNQIEGVTTLLLKSSDLSGKVKGDVVVIESDERYARHTFRHVKPTHFVMTNLYRDQTGRNAHPFWIYDILSDAVELIPDATLILNANDPIVSKFGHGRERVLYFGMDKNAYSSESPDSLFNDAYYCPICGAPLTFEYFHYTHLSKYSCPSCSFATPEQSFKVDKMDLENNLISINGNEIKLFIASKYNVYNLCAAFAVCSLVGIEDAKIASSLSAFALRNGRILRYRAGENEGIMVTGKHENSTSYNQGLEYITACKEKFDLAIFVDRISKRYYTNETSWLWDITFEKLEGSKVDRIFIGGNYAYDLAARLEVTDIDMSKVTVSPDIEVMINELKKPSENKSFILTCYGEKSKIFDRIENLSDL